MTFTIKRIAMGLLMPQKLKLTKANDISRTNKMVQRSDKKGL